MADLILCVCLLGMLWAVLAVAFGEVPSWVFLIPAAFFVAALTVGFHFVWDKASNALLARLEVPRPGMEGQRPRPVLRFVLTSQISRNLSLMLLAASLVIVLAPIFELAIGDALIGVMILFAFGVLLGPTTRALLRWSGVQPSKDGGQP